MATLLLFSAALLTVPSPVTAAVWNDNGGLVFWGEGAPAPITPDTVWTALHNRTITSLADGGSGQHTCALDSNGEAVCFGDSFQGQLGAGKVGKFGPAWAVVSRLVGSGVSAVVTDNALAGNSLSDITAGGVHTCAIDMEGKAYCWGLDNNGQLGNGAAGHALEPRRVSTSGALKGKTLVDISAGRSHTCAVAANGRAYCWGSNADGQVGAVTQPVQPVPVAVDTSGALHGINLIAIDSGRAHTCAVAANGSVYCWGDNTFGQIGDGTTTNRPLPRKVANTGADITAKAISVGDDGSCALTRSGNLFCWGSGHTTPVVVRALRGTDIQHFTTGYGHTCAITGAKRTFCWGNNNYGEIGNGTTVYASKPSPIDMSGELSGRHLVDIAATQFGTCGLTAGGGIFCWGKAEIFQRNGADTTSPSRVLGVQTALNNKNIAEITEVGDTHTCALTDVGEAYCWGSNTQGQLGLGKSISVSRPAAVLTSGALDGITLAHIAAGASHTCATSDLGVAYCWGEGEFGQLGNGSVLRRYMPRAVDASGVLLGKDLVDIDAGRESTCALDSDGAAYCWGFGGNGELGDGGTNGSLVPVAVSTSGVLQGKTLVDIDVGSTHACAIDSDGAAYCWGDNVVGQIGDGTGQFEAHEPVAVDTSGVLNGHTLMRISAGKSTTCALDTVGKVFCWGQGAWGQMGNVSGQGDNIAPVEVDTTGVLAGVVISDISVGGDVVCALSDDGQVFCWGLGIHGETGAGDFQSSQVPVAVDATGVLSGARVSILSAGDTVYAIAEPQ